MYKKIEELNPASRGVDLLVKVIEISPSKEVTTKDGKTHNVAEVLVGDETGCVLLSLWDESIEKVKVGQTLSIKNGYVSLFRGSIRLNIGRYGSMELASEDLQYVNKENNISNRSYNQKIPEFRPLFRNDYSRKRRRR
ncbi:MAG: single-stranded DNA-binding protein [Candidatus Methanomethylicota archaeon]|jgi:replication factor A1|uniref:Single-stranded DNA-binding protein n=1 Tax=Thermoproteota archaeon TaxID=2056631 RepID=A0A523BDG5_9CREN|nr:MAG: single-stranded DNA-binding protein [Candidatus Verstraetearchaeota archaeon]TDA38996.1 MAG: single-stranded DNA-binding protein [Candidatus Verstraetearchaeota archaeon]